MESYILLIIAFIVSAGSLYIGFRIGRASSASGAGRPANSGSGSAINISHAELESTRRTIEDAIRTNEQTAEVIQKMREILNRSDSSINQHDSSSSAVAEEN